MNAKDRLYERKFSKFVNQLPPQGWKKTCAFYDGHLRIFNASVDKTPAGRKINLIVRMRLNRSQL